MADLRCDCGAAASCLGKYSGEDDEIYCCDNCCDHDQVDGYCAPIAKDTTSWEELRTQKFSAEEIRQVDSEAAEELKKS